jgi:hypothetical protein
MFIMKSQSAYCDERTEFLCIVSMGVIRDRIDLSHHGPQMEKIVVVTKICVKYARIRSPSMPAVSILTMRRLFTSACGCNTFGKWVCLNRTYVTKCIVVKLVGVA